MPAVPSLDMVNPSFGAHLSSMNNRVRKTYWLAREFNFTFIILHVSGPEESEETCIRIVLHCDDRRE